MGSRPCYQGALMDGMTDSPHLSLPLLLILDATVADWAGHDDRPAARVDLPPAIGADDRGSVGMRAFRQTARCRSMPCVGLITLGFCSIPPGAVKPPVWELCIMRS